MKINPVIGQNLKAYRERFAFTQDTFSEYLGVNRVELSYYENGKRPVPVSIVSKAADIFGINGYELYQQEPENAHSDLAFAFRADNLNAQEISEISKFKKIVKNYLQMKKLIDSE